MPRASFVRASVAQKRTPPTESVMSVTRLGGTLSADRAGSAPPATAAVSAAATASSRAPLESRVREAPLTSSDPE